MDPQVEGTAATTKRLLSQLVNEGLMKLTLIDPEDPSRWRGDNCVASKTGHWIELSMANSMSFTVRLARPVWRPNDFALPVILCTESGRRKESDPGSIFEFLGPWNASVEESEEQIAIELRNSAAVAGERLKYSASQPLLTLQSSFLDWENAVILGHPTYPFHRNCVPDKSLAPLPPSELSRLTNPTISILLIPCSDVCVYGEFENLIKPLLESFGISNSAPADHIIVPYHAEQVPAILEAFPLVRVIKSVPGRARCQSSLRTVTITNYELDLKFSVAYRIGSQYRQFGRPAVSIGLAWAKILHDIVPENLWLFEEIAGVAGDDEKMEYHSSCRLACVLRQKPTARADANDEALIVSAALMEKPCCDGRTYAEILFRLDNREQKVEWFTRLFSNFHDFFCYTVNAFAY
ncbi:hypothetical protein AA313_de0204836 [Arthrobotrys entomopaga]|nr:hypothetical protein AA313_de0204836 [Arthrobotrys entomopaga]